MSCPASGFGLLLVENNLAGAVIHAKSHQPVSAPNAFKPRDSLLRTL
jgi:hypothetical protein